jgi:hypothetical protein
MNNQMLFNRSYDLKNTEFLLDTHPGATAAFSLRKLRSNYTGPAIKVRRSLDDAELDIGFNSAGNLDTVALMNFVGSSSGFVSV